MVEQTRRPSPVVSHQAGPGEVGAGTLSGMNLRVNDRAARAFGRRLAVIGDQLNREWASRKPNRLRHLFALSRTRDSHGQMRGFQGLSAAVKAWIARTAPGKRILKANTWVSSVSPVPCPGWTRGGLLTVALVAAVTFSLHYGWNLKPGGL